jgi:hypothetical protein
MWPALQEAQCGTTQAAFQVWPPKSGRYWFYSWWWAYSCPKHVETIKTAYLVASSWSITFTVNSIFLFIVANTTGRTMHLLTYSVWQCWRQCATERGKHDDITDAILSWLFKTCPTPVIINSKKYSAETMSLAGDTTGGRLQVKTHESCVSAALFSAAWRYQTLVL